MTITQIEEMRAAHVDGFHMQTADDDCVFCARDAMHATRTMNRQLVEQNAELLGRLVTLRTQLDDVRAELQQAQRYIEDKGC